ncbi:MAG TPA: HAD family hydrolase [Bacteroidales bacterium]|nr:HAD family hydrolase [Bacteroidales bacterium]
MMKKLETYKIVIFDIDGTLMDTEKAILCALQKLLKEEKNINFSKEELAFILGIPGKEALRRLKIADPDRALGKWDQYLSQYFSYIQIFPEIESTLKSLQALGIKTGIVTSKTRHEYEKDFIPFGLGGYFQHVICADDTVNHKPHPEPIIKCLELASEQPSQAIYIGDTIYDMQCASSAGVDFALALWGTRNKEMESDYKLASPSEILNIINIAVNN